MTQPGSVSRHIARIKTGGDRGEPASDDVNVLCERYFSVLQRYVRKHFPHRCHHVSTDAVDRALFELLCRDLQDPHKAEKISNRHTLHAALFNKVRCAAIDSYRREKKHRDTVRLGCEDAQHDACAELPSRDADPQDEVVHDEMLRHVEVCLSELGEEDRRAFDMRFFEGLPFRTIAERLNRAEATVRYRIKNICDSWRKASP